MNRIDKLNQFKTNKKSHQKQKKNVKYKYFQHKDDGKNKSTIIESLNQWNAEVEHELENNWLSGHAT